MSKAFLGARIAAVYELHSEWMEPRLEAMGVSWSSFQLLTTVANAGASASQIEVATRLGVTAATLSEAVQAHVQSGLIARTQSTKDKRVKILQLTPHAQEILRKIRDLVVESEEAMTRGVLPDEIAVTRKVLDRMMQNLESALDRENP